MSFCVPTTRILDNNILEAAIIPDIYCCEYCLAPGFVLLTAQDISLQPWSVVRLAISYQPGNIDKVNWLYN